jgi:hypothetical protein
MPLSGDVLGQAGARYFLHRLEQVRHHAGHPIGGGGVGGAIGFAKNPGDNEAWRNRIHADVVSADFGSDAASQLNDRGL